MDLHAGQRRADDASTRATRGAVSTEYVMVLAIVGLTLASVLVSLGPSVVVSWAFARSVLYGQAP
jgi:Flp pilus assembly pilin Flp